VTSAEDVAARPPLTVQTAVAGLVLRELDPSEAQAFADLVACNRDHLLAGNGSVPPDRVEDVVDQVCFRAERSFGFGLWLGDDLIGHFSIGHLSYSPGAPEELMAPTSTSWGIGYWLGAEFTGHGYATEACRTLMDYVQAAFGATDFYAMPRVGNQRSQVVLERLGFDVYERTGTSIQYRLLGSF
jgi:ribosomal-protein-serine acetyltransferase